MRHAAQCVGRALRGKTDYGLMIFADKVNFLFKLKFIFSDFVERINVENCHVGFKSIFTNLRLI